MVAPSLDLASALDPVVFARRTGIQPDEWQQRVLRSSSDRVLLNCSRQVGKSTVTAWVSLHTAIYEPNSLILLLSPSLRQSAELFRTVSRTWVALGETVPAKAESSLRLELENGSRIVSLPASDATIRGFAGVRLLVIDEASRVPDELYFAVRPMLAASGGRLVALSTPYGSRGWWYEAWHSSEAWERYRIPASECPRIKGEFLAEERRNLGEWWYLQEYSCTFLDAETQAFRREDIDKAFVQDADLWEL